MLNTMRIYLAQVLVEATLPREIVQVALMLTHLTLIITYLEVATFKKISTIQVATTSGINFTGGIEATYSPAVNLRYRKDGTTVYIERV